MKKTYVFSMKTLAFIILCTVSIYIMLCNGVELYKYNHPHSLNELSAGVYFIIFGGSVTLTNYWWEIKLFGVVLVFIGIKQIYKAFINSDNRFALRIASIFEIDTVNHKKKMCVRRIEYLENQSN